MAITENQVVSINYTLKDDSGETLDSSEGHGPLVYLHGHKQIIPGLETEISSRSVGDKFSVVVPPEEAYGTRREELLQQVPREEFKDFPDLAEGAEFEVETDGGPIIVEVVALSDSHVTLDGNHPLAGRTLHFDVELVAVRDATEEEISHGHAHDENHSEDCDGGTVH